MLARRSRKYKHRAKSEPQNIRARRGLISALERERFTTRPLDRRYRPRFQKSFFLTPSEKRAKRAYRKRSYETHQDYLTAANAAFQDASYLDRRKALLKPLSAVDSCIKSCKGKSRRRRGSWRGRTGPGFATVLKNRICQLRCKR